jgi:hypothetical protein
MAESRPNWLSTDHSRAQLPVAGCLSKHRLRVHAAPACLSQIKTISPSNHVTARRRNVIGGLEQNERGLRALSEGTASAKLRTLKKALWILVLKHGCR